MMEFNRVNPDSLDAVWAVLDTMIRRGLAHGQGAETSSEHMRESVRAGIMHLWVVHEDGDIKAGLVFSIIETMTRKIWVEMLAGEDMDDWIDPLQSLLAEYRDLEGASSIEASCRPGLAKYLKRKGWSQKAIIMSLEQEDG